MIFKHRQLLLLFVFMFSLLVIVSAQTAVQAEKASEFRALNAEIEEMHEKGLIVGGKTWESLGLNPEDYGKIGDETVEITAELQKIITGKGKPIVFLKENASAYSNDAIQIVEEMVALSNELMSELSDEKTSISDDSFDAKKYQNLAEYYELAQEFNSMPVADAALIASQVVCGWYANPVPNYEAPTIQIASANSYGDGEQILFSIGYHTTPQSAGGGYTRPETYNWWLCGFGTFRDAGWLDQQNGLWRVWEQNYTGSIPGEPNPEVWRTGPWPYVDWPAYVAWWHYNY